jgi:hypothetical protein
MKNNDQQLNDLLMSNYGKTLLITRCGFGRQNRHLMAPNYLIINKFIILYHYFVMYACILHPFDP